LYSNFLFSASDSRGEERDRRGGEGEEEEVDERGMGGVGSCEGSGSGRELSLPTFRELPVLGEERRSEWLSLDGRHEGGGRGGERERAETAHGETGERRQRRERNNREREVRRVRRVRNDLNEVQQVRGGSAAVGGEVR
jgi:hypothetical protein